MSNPNDRTLIVSIVLWYGRETIKPQCRTSTIFAELLGQTTLTRANVNAIKRLGYEVRTKETKEIRL